MFLRSAFSLHQMRLLRAQCYQTQWESTMPSPHAPYTLERPWGMLNSGKLALQIMIRKEKKCRQ